MFSSLVIHFRSSRSALLSPSILVSMSISIVSALSPLATYSRSSRSTSLSPSISVSMSIGLVSVLVSSRLSSVSKQLSMSDLLLSKEELSIGCWRRYISTRSTKGDDDNDD